jgi:hypothetical protein
VNESDVDLEVAFLFEGSVGATQVAVIHTVLFSEKAAVHSRTVRHHVDLQVALGLETLVWTNRALELFASTVKLSMHLQVVSVLEGGRANVTLEHPPSSVFCNPVLFQAFSLGVGFGTELTAVFLDDGALMVGNVVVKLFFLQKRFSTQMARVRPDGVISFNMFL